MTVPPDVKLGETFHWRFRLDYGENGSTNEDVVHHATEENRDFSESLGGALWGEVEDHPSKAVEVDKFRELQYTPSGSVAKKNRKDRP